MSLLGFQCAKALHSKALWKVKVEKKLNNFHFYLLYLQKQTKLKKTMHKQDVINLINFGILHVSAHELGPEHSYKVFHMKRTFELANKAISDEQDAILKDAGIDDAFRQKAADINKKLLNKEALSIEEREWLDKANSMQQSADKLLREMLKADTEIPALKALPYEIWRELQKENRAKEVNGKTLDILGGPAEILLADIFWQAPEEKTEKTEETPKKNLKNNKS